MDLHRWFAKLIPNSLKIEVYPLFFDDSAPAVQANQLIATAPVTFLVSVATVPTLAAIVVLQVVLHQVQTLAASTEEAFRGDRLPLLPFPEQSQPLN